MDIIWYTLIQRKHFLVCFMIIIGIGGIMLYNTQLSNLSGNNYGIGMKTAYADNISKDIISLDSRDGNRSKLILLWTSFWGMPLWEMKGEISRGGHFMNELCQLRDSCTVTNDKMKLEEADAVVFHCRDNFKWPAVRYPHQIYVLFCIEPPCQSNFKHFNRKINMTATYRSDSDLPVPYYTLIPQVNPVIESYVPRIPLKTKTRTAVWIGSKCNRSSYREDYVNELAKYIDVDKYGKCGNLSCDPPRSQICYNLFEKKYKFYLSFENSICKDYVTEKLYKPLELEIIPVVLGGANYSHYAPHHSYINVMDYQSPEHLARFLKALSENETAYQEYFQWKANYSKIQIGRLQSFFCDLCNTLKLGNYMKTSERDISAWWHDGTCDNSFVPKALSKSIQGGIIKSCSATYFQ